MSAHNRRGARLAAILLLLAFTATPLRAHGQTATSATRTWNTYLGGSGQERVTSVAHVPSNGNVVVGGWTTSLDFPSGTNTSPSTTKDSFLFILSPIGGAVGSPFVFGGTGNDQINAVAIGVGGQIYAVGTTQTIIPGITSRYGNVTGPDAAFLVSFDSMGVPQWIMYLDGGGSDTGLGVTVVGNDIYVTGQTTDCSFLNASPSCVTSGTEAFVVKVNSIDQTVAWPRLIPGNLDDSFSQSVVVGSRLVAVGTTGSTSFNFASGVVKNFSQGGRDMLVAGLDANTGAVSWVEFVGGPQDDTGAGIVVANGKIAVAGTVGTPDERANVLATWMDAEGVRNRTETVAGGSQDEVVSSIAADSSGNVYIGGRTNSENLPRSWAFDTQMEVAIVPQEGFVVVMPEKAGPGWTSFVGGSGKDEVLSLSIRGTSLVMAGETFSASNLLDGPGYDTSMNGVSDGFIVNVNTDISPPELGTVNDRPEDDVVLEDIDTQTSLTSIAANWNGFTDGETGVFRYEWGIGFSPGADNVSQFRPISISGQTSFMKSGLTLVAGRPYYTTVRAINGAGLVSVVSSDGVSPGVTDGGTGDGGTGDGGTSDGGTGDGGTVDGGTGDGGTTGDTDGGTGEEPGKGKSPLMGWSCTAADAGLPMLAGLLALALLARRRGSRPR